MVGRQALEEALKYITVKDAAKLPAGWDEQANIHRSGSVRGMISRFGWLPGHAFRIGQYIYHFPGGPIFEAAERIAKQ